MADGKVSVGDELYPEISWYVGFREEVFEKRTSQNQTARGCIDSGMPRSLMLFLHERSS